MPATGDEIPVSQKRLTNLLPCCTPQGLRNAILTATKGTAVLNTNFLEYAPWAGDLSMREFGSLTAFETGQSSTYALTRCDAVSALQCAIV